MGGSSEGRRDGTEGREEEKKKWRDHSRELEWIDQIKEKNEAVEDVCVNSSADGCHLQTKVRRRRGEVLELLLTSRVSGEPSEPTLNLDFCHSDAASTLNLISITPRNQRQIRESASIPSRRCLAAEDLPLHVCVPRKET